MAKISLPGETPTKVKLEKGNLYKDIKSLPIDKQKYFESVLDAALKKIILQGIENFHKGLIVFLDGFTINHTQYEDKKMSDVYRDVVIPYLEENKDARDILYPPNPKSLDKTKKLDLPVTQANLESTIQPNPDASLYKDNRIVKDVLNLNQKIGENPIFGKEVRDFKNESVLDIAKVTGSLKDTLIAQNIDFEKATKSDWERLVKENIITEEQKTNLLKVTEVYRFTGGSSGLSAKLLESNSLEDAVKYDIKGWVDLINKSGKETVNDMSIEEYASALSKAAQKKYPSTFFLERKVKREISKSSLISELSRQTTGSRTKQKLVSEEYGEITKMAISNYSYLGAKEVIDNFELGAEVKAEKIEVMQKDMKAFFESTKSIDLKSGDYLSIDLKDNSIFGEKTTSERVAIRNQALSYQRVTRLAPSFEGQEALLTIGLDSSHKIATQPISNVRTSLSGLNEIEIQNIIGTAQHMHNTAVHTTMSFQGISSSNYFGLTVLDYPEEMKNSLESIPGYTDFFGNQNYCECDHCKSILSPSAYFVDLMKFVDENVYLHLEDVPKEHIERDVNNIALKNRRPDLWHLELSCENTHKPVSYLRLINKIKISYLYRLLELGAESKPYEDKEKAVWEELARLPEPSGGSGGSSGSSASRIAPKPVKGEGNTWKYSFKVSHNQAFEESKVWMDALDLKYLDILKAFDVTTLHKKEAAYLGISEEEWFVLVTPDNDLDELKELRFGFPLNDLTDPNDPKCNIDQCPVIELQRATGLSREDVEILFSLESMPGYVDKDDRRAYIYREEVTGEIQQYVEYIIGLNDAEVLDFTHRFVRLWRHLPKWSMIELDVAVKSFYTFDATSISEIARVYEAQQVFGITFEEAMTLSSILQEMPKKSLYKRKIFNAFLNSSIEQEIPSLYNSKLAVFKDQNVNVASLTSNGLFNSLLNVLQLNQWEYELAIDKLNFTNTTTFTESNILRCFRLAVLRKALNIGMDELIYLMVLDSNSVTFNTARTLLLKDKLEKVKANGITIDQMAFISDKFDFDNRSVKTRYDFIKWVNEFFNAKELYLTRDEIKTFMKGPINDFTIDNLIDELHYFIYNTPYHDLGYRFKYRDTEPELDDFIGNPNLNSLLSSPSDFFYKISEKYIGETVDDTIFKSKQKELVASKLRDLINQSLGLIKTDTLSFFPDWITNSNYEDLLINSMINSNWEIFDSELYDINVFDQNILEIERAVVLIDLIKLDKIDLEFIKDNKALFYITGSVFIKSFDDLKSFLTLSAFKEFKNDAESLKVPINDFFELISNVDLCIELPTSFDTDQQAIHERTRKTLATILKNDTSLLEVAIKIKGATAYTGKPTEKIVNIKDNVAFIQKINIHDKVILETFSISDYENADKYLHALKTSYQSKYTSLEDFDKASEEYLNKIEENKRDVLCAFIMGMRNINQFDSTSDMYAWFLVDVEMSGCARVSEILAATLSLQLYIHRVIMGLEQHINGSRMQLGKLDLQDALLKQWEWRKNYRVWEANRKVFLFPENWIEPELRDNKTPLLKTLEDELLQQKITLESAEAAYKEYLKGFEEVGQLAIVGAYYFEKDGIPCHYIFGRTKTDPYIYYFRLLKMIGSESEKVVESWSPWEKVELSISSPEVTPFIIQNKLYIFWMEIQTEEVVEINGGTSNFKGYKHNLNVSYSHLNENGKWLQPQKLKFSEYVEKMEDYTKYKDEVNHYLFDIPFYGMNSDTKSLGRDFYMNSRTFNRIYIDPDKYSPFYRLIYNRHYIKYIYNTDWAIIDSEPSSIDFTRKIDFSLNRIRNSERNWKYSQYIQVFPNDFHSPSLFSNIAGWDDPHNLDQIHNAPNESSSPTELIKIINEYIDCIQITNSFIQYESLVSNNLIIKLTNEDLLLHKKFLAKGGYKYSLIKLNTKSIENLKSTLDTLGLEDLLSVTTQTQSIDSSIPASVVEISEIEPVPTESLHFKGSHGLYYQELFFHIPYTIANHLNKEGKYKEADYWYRKIFDPSAKYEPSIETDRYWQFLQFRNQTVESLMDMLTNEAAIDEYKNNPFNPHAIARIRISAYQKNIVMKYIDNILDWADSLFKMDTWEANTEALMLYMLAKDILGERPEPLGYCDTAVKVENCGCSEPLTYEAIKNYSGGLETSDFIHYVDNWIPISSIATEGVVGDSSGNGSISPGGSAARTSIELETSEKIRNNQFSEVYSTELLPMLGTQTMIKKGSNLVFCIPHNEKIFEYWDRVEDRLFKLRNCMNIDGVKRSLALFQPPIDPALLVAAFAAGLSIDDVLNSLYGDLPAYRFSYLIERAKGYAGTVQGMANSLLSALEKNDNEQLTLLRSTQEQNLLKMTKEVKKKAIDDAKANLQATIEGMNNTINRITQYAVWIEENLNSWETTQQISKHTASTISIITSKLEKAASVSYLIPQIGALTAMKFGGKEAGDSAKTVGQYLSTLAQIAEIVSSSAGLEASFQRRKQDWEFQLKLSEQELKQVQQQIISAQIRLAMAEKDLEIHEKQMDQVKEVHEFYKSKFTNLDLYGFLSKALNTYHRMAYNMAVDMAKQAEAAYKFETGDDTYTGVSGGTFWDSTKAGLLSGEQLTLELQKMEVKYMEWNQRQMEIRQSFSMLMLDPEQLMNLRKDGACTFTIPEWAFDLQYPGHYRRRIVSVQLTMPCIVGPYQNVAATLTLTKGSLNKLGKEGGTTLFPFGGNKMVATSSAQNDGGQFDLNFRDERYLPFEGAGVVESEWRLELPTAIRSFDYNAIADVIFHISYRSKYDGVFKGVVETGLKTTINGGGLKRLVSLKNDFPNEWHSLNQGHNTSLEMNDRMFPYFAKKRKDLGLEELSVLDPDILTVSINGNNINFVLNVGSKLTEDYEFIIKYKIEE